MVLFFFCFFAGFPAEIYPGSSLGIFVYKSLRNCIKTFPQGYFSENPQELHQYFCLRFAHTFLWDFLRNFSTDSSRILQKFLKLKNLRITCLCRCNFWQNFWKISGGISEQILQVSLKTSQEIFLMETQKQLKKNILVGISAGITEGISQRILGETLGRISEKIPAGFVKKF